MTTARRGTHKRAVGHSRRGLDDLLAVVLLDQERLIVQKIDDRRDGPSALKTSPQRRSGGASDARRVFYWNQIDEQQLHCNQCCAKPTRLVFPKSGESGNVDATPT